MTIAQTIIETLPFIMLFFAFVVLAICCATERCKLTEYFLRVIERRTRR